MALLPWQYDVTCLQARDGNQNKDSLGDQPRNIDLDIFSEIFCKQLHIYVHFNMLII